MIPNTASTFMSFSSKSEFYTSTFCFLPLHHCISGCKMSFMKTTRLLCRTSLSLSYSSFPQRNTLFTSISFKSVYPASARMSSLYVKNHSDEERLQINLDLKVGNGMKTFNLDRLKNEEVRIAFERLRASLEKKTKKKQKKKKKKVNDDAAQGPEEDVEEDNPIPLEMLHNGEPISLSVCNDRAWIHGAVLRIGEENISVTYNAPIVTLRNLSSTIMQGYPLFPEADFEFCELNSCEFHWTSVEKRNIDTVKKNLANGVFDFSETSVGLSYSPKMEDLGKHILLLCLPKSGDKVGKASGVVSPTEIVAGPDLCPFESRQKSFTRDFSKDGEFRVISYNILAEVYTNTEFAKSQLFIHCPENALEMAYRKQLLLKEISGYKADLVCLQEVDRSVFTKQLTPGLKLHGYEGFFRSKKGGVSEGCATFIRSDKFRVVNQLDIVLSEYLANDDSCKDLWDKICQVPALKEKLELRSSILQVTVVESIERPGQFVCVANTHLFFHPRACNIRLIHAATALRYLQAISTAYAQEGKSISLVFCGDFNSSPDVGVYQLMTSQFIQEDHADWLSGGEEEALKDVELSHSMEIVSGCGTPPFTHYGQPIQCTLDYVYVEASSLEVVSSVPMLDLEDVKAYTYLPNPLIPSDHLALVCDVRFKS